MGFFHGKTSKQTARVKNLLELALSRLAIARRPRLARKTICRSDVGQLLSLGYLHRALLRAEQVIEEDNMLQSFDIIELYCKRLVEHATQLDKPQECSEEIREAAAGIMFAASWCGDLPELQFARTILEDKFGGDLAAIAKEGTGIVDPMSVIADQDSESDDLADNVQPRGDQPGKFCSVLINWSSLVIMHPSNCGLW